MAEVNNFRMSTSDVFHTSMSVLSEGISDILASNKEKWILSAVHMVQQLNRKKQFLEQLSKEWDYSCKKNLIKNDYEETEQHQECLFEILDALDQEVPVKTKFALLKKIFIITASEKVLDRFSILPQEYMRVCRSLSTGEIMIVFAAYQIAKKKSWGNEIRLALREWDKMIAEASRLVHPELVAIHAEGLEKKRLLFPPDGPQKDRRPVDPTFGLTKFCWGICEYIRL